MGGCPQCRSPTSSLESLRIREVAGRTPNPECYFFEVIIITVPESTKYGAFKQCYIKVA